MKISLISDAHLEFDPDFRMTNTQGADVLILSGDILVADYLTRSEASPYSPIAEKFKDFFKRAADEFSHVVYIAGNHEYYHSSIEKVPGIIQEHLVSLANNIHFLDNSAIEIDGITFVGGTLWTSVDNGNPVVQWAISRMMNDYRLIKFNHNKWLPEHQTIMHRKALSKMTELLEGVDKAVLCVHHAPSVLSIHENYKHDTYMNFGYHSVLDDWILAHPQLALVTHGHVHNSFSYNIGQTKVACNPKGYKDENATFDPNFMMEI
jgi:Icc-related predicted phosphoesterase